MRSIDMTPRQLVSAIEEMGYQTRTSRGVTDRTCVVWPLGEERPSAGLFAHTGEDERQALHRKYMHLRSSRS